MAMSARILRQPSEQVSREVPLPHRRVHVNIAGRDEPRMVRPTSVAAQWGPVECFAAAPWRAPAGDIPLQAPRCPRREPRPTTFDRRSKE